MKKIRLTKRGSNVGVVLSFVIFIAFLFFVFTVLKPKLTFGENKQSTVDYLSTQLMNDFNSNLTTIYINMTRDVNRNCVEFQNFMTQVGSSINISSNLSAKDGNTSANLVTRLVSGSNLEINRANTNSKFFKVYYSPEFNNSAGAKIDSQCTLITVTNPQRYSISYIKVDVYAFESRINYTLFIYNTSYNTLRTKYKLPADTNFGFSFKNAEGIIKQTSYTVPKTVNVYSNEVPILYVDNNATIKSGFLTVVLW